MIFSELYSAYYNTVARILAKALEPGVTERDLLEEVKSNAFSESITTILPALKSGKWQLLHDDLSPVVYEAPTMPLTTLQKRWLKSLLDDPRLRLFDVKMPDLEDVEPLFTRKDYKVYDRYADGDPFEDENYIKHFRLIHEAIKQNRPVKLTMENRFGNEFYIRLFPKGFEYSLKDDKIRILATGCRFRQFNLGRVLSCSFYEGGGPWREKPKPEQKRGLEMVITNERNALERAMIHFSHFERQAEKIDSQHYLLKLKYYENDEKEVVIRVLSFGPFIKVVAPEHFVNLVKERLIMQKECNLK